MKYATPFFVVIILMFCLDGCSLIGIEPCPKDQKLGDLQLDNPNFSPYRGNESLVFENQSGKNISLTNFEYGNLSPHQRLVVSRPCYTSEFINQEIYYDVPRVFFTYSLRKSDYRNTINYSFGIQDMRNDYDKADTILAEVLTIDNSFTRPNSALRILISDRGNRANFDPVKGPYLRLTQYRVINDTTLNGRPYKQVYCANEAPTVYFNTKEGILAFKDEQEWWYKSY